MAGRPRYRAGSYKARSARSRALLYGLVAVVILWLIGPFIWLFVTSVSYQRNLLARPLPFALPAPAEPNP
jgi:ABC-type glycerol-3-phosphate transport system permease component